LRHNVASNAIQWLSYSGKLAFVKRIFLSAFRMAGRIVRRLHKHTAIFHREQAGPGIAQGLEGSSSVGPVSTRVVEFPVI
jgi:hypothetical protein